MYIFYFLYNCYDTNFTHLIFSTTKRPKASCGGFTLLFTDLVHICTAVFSFTCFDFDIRSQRNYGAQTTVAVERVSARVEQDVTAEVAAAYIAKPEVRKVRVRANIARRKQISVSRMYQIVERAVFVIATAHRSRVICLRYC